MGSACGSQNSEAAVVAVQPAPRPHQPPANWRKIHEFHRGDGCVIGGLATLDNVLFMVSDNESFGQLVYYRTQLPTFYKIYFTDISRMSRAYDMTACPVNHCLYIAGSDQNETQYFVYRVVIVAPSRKGRTDIQSMTSWKTDARISGISVTAASCNVLVTCPDKRKLIEFTPNGRRVRQIQLMTGADAPRHAVQLYTGQFAVCFDDANRVRLIDADGSVVRSFGGGDDDGGPSANSALPAKDDGSTSDGGQNQHLNGPKHLAVDVRSGYVYVADCHNRRIVVLSPSLEYTQHFASHQDHEEVPKRCFLDVDAGRLYVAHSLHSGAISVFDDAATAATAPV